MLWPSTIYFALSELTIILRFISPGATRLAPLSACPWLSYFAPLALCFDFCAKPAKEALDE
jgi:hypothetical protein